MDEKKSSVSVTSTRGDTRRGMGLRSDGLPDIAWCDVPSGDVFLEQRRENVHVNSFQIAKYPVTWSQYRAFLEASDGHHNLVRR